MSETTAVELVDRYLGVVGPFLPAGQRADILAEIREALLSRLEERQRQLGRALTQEETEDVLKAYGHPLAVAAPYGAPRPLIGPVVLPWYWLVLRVVLAIAWIGSLVHAGIAFASGDTLGHLLGQLAQAVLSATIQVTGTVTIIAMVLDRLGAGVQLAQGFSHMQASWRPRDLPRPIAPVTVPSVTGWTVTGDLIWVGLVTLWATGALDSIVAPLSAVTHLQLAPIVLSFRWPLLAAVIVHTVLHVMSQLQAQPKLRPVLYVIFYAVVLAALAVLLRHWPWVEVVGLPAAAAAGVAHGMNTALGITWGVVTFVVVGGLLWNVAALRGGRKAAADPGGAGRPDMAR